MGADDYEKACVPQLIDFMFRHTANVFEESRVYAAHCGRKVTLFTPGNEFTQVAGHSFGLSIILTPL